jgi:hypothetical protein
MATVTFDTMQYVDTLTEAGVPEAQAKAMAKAQSVAIESATDIRLATKNDVIVIREDIQAIKHELKSIEANIYKSMLVQTFAIAGLVAGIMAVVLKLFMQH